MQRRRLRLVWLLDNFDGTPAYPSAFQNDLGKWTGGNCFLDGGGSGIVTGGATKVFGDFTLDGGAHPVLATSYQDIKIPMVANGINRNSPSQLAMGFWFGGSATITIDHISFQ